MSMILFLNERGKCENRFLKKRKEVWNEIEIIRIPEIPRGKSTIGMICNYLSFPISGFFWKIFTKVKADYVFMFETSPMTQCVIGVWYAKKHKVPLYLYAQDLWPENVHEVLGIRFPPLTWVINRVVDKIYRASDRILCASNGFVENLKGKGVPSIRNKSVRGDHYVTLVIEVPTKLSEDAKEALRQFDALSGNSLTQASGPQSAKFDKKSEKKKGFMDKIKESLDDL